MSAGEYIEAPPGKDCSKFDGGWGLPMTDYEFIWYGNIDEDKYPDDACKPYIHKSAQIDSFQVNTDIRGTATAVNLPASTITCTHVNASGTITHQLLLLDQLLLQCTLLQLMPLLACCSSNC